MNRLRTTRAGLGALCLLALTLVAAPASAVAAPGDTLLVHRASGIGPADANNIPFGTPDSSANGRYVAFSSVASNLDPDDTDTVEDVFVRDVQENTTTLVSRASTPLGPKGTSASTEPSISPDGRYVAFRTSSALVPDDVNGVDDIYVRDLSANTTARVSLATDGAQADGASFRPSISGNGRVAFESDATNLLGPGNDTNEQRDAFVRDLSANTTRVVSRPSGAGGPDANGPSFEATISADGRVVAFGSDATNLVEPLPPGQLPIDPGQLYARNLEANTTVRVTVDRFGGQPEQPGGRCCAGGGGPSISADGRFVAFFSNGEDYVEGDTNDQSDVFVRDLKQGTTTRASVANDGSEGGRSSGDPSISLDGSRVAFRSLSTNLVEGDTNGFSDVFVRDLDTGTTTLASRPHRNEPPQANGSSSSPAISGDGRFVAFKSTADNLIAEGDPPNRFGRQDTDIFRRELAPPSADLSLTAAGSPRSVTVGRDITYTFTATNRGPNVGRSVTLTDPLPAGVTFKSSSASQGSCTPSADRRTVTCDLGALARDATARVTIVVTADRAGTVVNTASVTGSADDPNPADNSASVATAVTAPAARPPTPQPARNRCTITRGSGNDVIRGTRGNDVICAGGGNDVVYGLGGNDTILGQGGNDALRGGPGNDNLSGGSGNDSVSGGPGNDSLVGSSGNDSLSGGSGNDSLSGGSGNDSLSGGPGRDRRSG